MSLGYDDWLWYPSNPPWLYLLNCKIFFPSTFLFFNFTIKLKDHYEACSYKERSSFGGWGWSRGLFLGDLPRLLEQQLGWGAWSLNQRRWGSLSLRGEQGHDGNNDSYLLGLHNLPGSGQGLCIHGCYNVIHTYARNHAFIRCPTSLGF